MGASVHQVLPAGVVLLGGSLAIACSVLRCCRRRGLCSFRDQPRESDHPGAPALELAQNGTVPVPAAYTPEVVINVDEGIRKLSYEELESATNSFSNAAKIGEGHFADVYKAKLPNTDKWVAIKKLKDSVQDKRLDAFHKEVNNAGNLRHRCLVKLIGYAYKRVGQVLLIVFDYIPNGNLHSHLFDTELAPLSWEIRFQKVACGLAAGLDYLHFGGERCLIHRDIKPLNVMLDRDFTPKLGDFGLSKLTDHGKSVSYNGTVSGTPYYMAPEVVYNGDKASLESDVFSFGMVALQLATGKKEGDDGLPLVSWVWSLYNAGQVLKAVDPRLEDNYKKDEAKRLLGVGLACCHWIPTGRPTMKEVISMLDGKSPIQVKPIQGFHKNALRSKNIIPSSSTTQGGSGRNTRKVGNSEQGNTSNGTPYYTPTASLDGRERERERERELKPNVHGAKFSKSKPPLPR